MNQKILIISVIFIVAALSGGGLFVYQDLIKSQAAKEQTPPAVEETKPTVKEEAPKETLLVKDDFEITLPAGWQEVKDFQGVLAMVVDTAEEITNEKAKNIEFRTNFSIKKDDMAKYGTLSGTEDYVKSIKNSLVQLIPGISFTREEQRTIDGRSAFFIECVSTQEGIDFKTLLVFIEGSDNMIWAISFNTFQDSWDNYRNLFYQIAESFKLEYQLEL